MAYPTNADLAARIRADATDPAIPGIAAAAQAYIDSLAFVGLPEDVRNEAYQRYVGYLYDAPEAAPGTGYANAWRNSGADAITARWRKRGAGVIGEAASSSSSTVPAPAPSGEGVSEQRVAKLIEEHAGEANAHHTPPTLPMPATPAEAARGTSGAIRAWTSALIRTAINAVVPAWARSGDATPIPAPKLANAPRDSHLDIVNTLNGRLPAPPVALRLGWSQSRTMTAAVFTRANNHPIDGAAIGTTAGLTVPPFPPALDTDLTLYLGVWLAGDPDIAAIQRAANDETANFPAGDKRALAVNGTSGHYYPSRVRFNPLAGDLLRVVVPGPRILTENDDVAGGAAPRWWEMARLLTNDLGKV